MRVATRYTRRKMAADNVGKDGDDTSDYQRSTPSPRDCGVDDWGCSRAHCESDRESTDSGAYSDSGDSKTLVALPGVTVQLEKIEIRAASSKNGESEQESIPEKRLRCDVGAPDTLDGFRMKQLRKARLEQFLNLPCSQHSDVDLRTEASSTFFLPSSTTFTTTTTTAIVKTTCQPLVGGDVESSSSGFGSSCSSTSSSSASSPAPFSSPSKGTFAPNTSKSSFPCRWQDCQESFDSTTKLLEHLKSSHAATQRPKDEKEEGFLYKCLWSGCKVFGKGSSSKCWLEKHLSNHCDKKPFACIFHATCKMRFSTKSLLERHVHAAHLDNDTWSSSSWSNSSSSPSSLSTSSARKFAPSLHTSSNQRHLVRRQSSNGDGVNASTLRMLRKSGKRLRYRSTLFSARIFDLFDLGVMAELRQKMHKSISSHLKLAPKVVGRKRNEHGHLMLLVRWGPGDTLEDEWIRSDALSFTGHGASQLPWALKTSICAPFLHQPATRVGRKRRAGTKTERSPLCGVQND